MIFIASILDLRNKFVYVSFPLEELLGEETGNVVNTKVEAYLRDLFAIYVSVKSELDKYLLEAQEPESEDFDILSWWKVNSPRFPVLSQLARDVLAIPMSSVASECAFSTGDRILDPFRSSLTPKCVQCLICVQHWLRQETKPICVEEIIWSTSLNRGQLVNKTLFIIGYAIHIQLKGKSTQ
uniref:HAT C-terminal dimerisation domain-containing protein n=1 Tax=Solanum lycopersicum TaxID=4081 RepID=A0A3Q7GKG6_SOLLC